jgi:hypothetical protein
VVFFAPFVAAALVMPESIDLSTFARAYEVIE